MTVAAWTGDESAAAGIARVLRLPSDRPRQWLDTPGCDGVWVMREGDDIGAVMRAHRTPDGRLRLHFHGYRTDGYPALAAKAEGTCVTMVTDEPPEALKALQGSGFRPERRELLIEIPVTDRQLPFPEGVSAVSIVDVDAEKVMRLDARLRDDVPGSSGWQPDLAWFLRENHYSPQFDPEAYLIAVDRGEPIGLVRIWRREAELPRVGLWGVLPEHRRRGIAAALLARTLAVWHRRDGTAVCTEIDETNTASRSLASSFGARIVGSTTELRRL